MISVNNKTSGAGSKRPDVRPARLAAVNSPGFMHCVFLRSFLRTVTRTVVTFRKYSARARETSRAVWYAGCPVEAAGHLPRRVPQERMIYVNTQARQSKLIIVTDEEADIREIVKMALEQLGYSVLPAANGAEAVAQYAARRGQVKAVIIDMRMPVMDGEATIRALRRLDPQVRIVASSGGGSKYEAMAANAGVRKFLRKPYGLEQLIRIMAEVMNDK
ncbi:MAG TPA: response regulator [Blastocatellia bacterium]|nr:response regulator [Blastocatellia bacterium]